MATFLPERWTYRPTASVTITNFKVPVNAFTLTLALSGIPKLVASIDPFHLVGANQQLAKAPGVDSFTATWRTLQDAIRDKEKRKVTFTFDAQGTVDNQAFTLKNWLLVGAGFSDVRAAGHFMMTIELMHPLFAFQESTPHLVGSVVQGEIPFSSVNSADVLDALKAAMSAYHERFSKGLSAVAKQDTDYNLGATSMVASYKEMIDAFSAHLAWDPLWTGAKLPVAAFTSNLADVVSYSVVEYVKAMNNAASWDWFIHTFCAHWFLCVIPVFYEPTLYLRPLTPWQAPWMTIFDTEIAKFDLPATDPMPVRGVMGIATAPIVEGPVTWSAFAESKITTTQEATAHQEPKLTGSILSLTTPPWMDNLLFYKAAKEARRVAPNTKNLKENVSWQIANNADSEEAGGLGTVYDSQTKEMLGAAKIVARELFLENYRLHYQIGITARLLIRSGASRLPGNWVLPGYVMRLQADKNLPNSMGRPLLDFFVMQVVHSVDCLNKYASTQINGAYIHEIGKPDIEAIQGGIAPNVMYGEAPMHSALYGVASQAEMYQSMADTGNALADAIQAATT